MRREKQGGKNVIGTPTSIGSVAKRMMTDYDVELKMMVEGATETGTLSGMVMKDW